MGVKRDIVRTSTDIIARMNPSFDKDQIEAIVKRIVKEDLHNPTVIMDNNVTGDGGVMTLTEFCSWIDKRNPVISGNATFYCQPEEMLSPTSNMLRALKKGRKAVKIKMFSYNPASDEYQMLDLEQGNIKVIMNAEYGGSGAPTAAFYTKYSPAATTLMAQSIITTMAAFFEGFVGDNQKFFSANECYDWMLHVIRKDQKIPKWIKRHTWEEVSRRIKMHFYMLSMDDYRGIDDFVSHCSDDELTYLYYANNLRQFVQDHPKIQNLIRGILTDLPNYQAAEKEVPAQFMNKFPKDGGAEITKYNKWMSKEMFLDPYSVPECIKPYMDELKALVTQFVYVEYITPDSIIKLNNHKRNTVLLVDTDSNIINADLFVAFIVNEIFPNDSFGRPKMYNEMILVNVLAALLDVNVASLLDFYGRCHHMNKESRAELTMKNEFMFRRLFLMLVKKRYCASIVLREGNIIIPFKPEIKGVDFIKAGVTDDVEKRFKKILMDYILFSDDIELHEMMTELKKFEREIYRDLNAGGTRYLKPQQFKAAAAYSNVTDEFGNAIGSKAWSLPVYRGSIAWNELFPTRKINSLDRVKVVKTVIQQPRDLEILRDRFPEDYRIIQRKIYNNPNGYIQNSGLKYICVPNSATELPPWMVAIIDKDVIVSDIMASFRSVLEALSIEPVIFKTPSGKANLPSAMIAV